MDKVDKMDVQNQHALNLENLPDLILFHIFDYLDNFDLRQTALVSWKFHKLSRSRKFISTTKINLDKVDNIDNLNYELLRYPEIHIYGLSTTKISQFTNLHGQHVKHLELGYCDSVRDLYNILKQTPNLSTLSVCFEPYFHKTVQVAYDMNEDFSYLPPIREFKYFNLSSTYDHLKQMLPIFKKADRKVKIKIDPRSFISASTTTRTTSTKLIDLLNTNLQELNIVLFSNTQIMNLLFDFGKLEHLEKFTIRGVFHKTNMLINNFDLLRLKYLKLSQLLIPVNKKLTLFEKIKDLTTLKVHCETFKSEDIIFVFKEFKNLQEFECKHESSSPNVYHGDFNFSKNENLTKISLKLSTKLPEQFLTNIAENVPNLKELILEHAVKLETINSVKCILKKCRHLQKLQIQGINSNYNAICEREPSSITLDNIKYLSLEKIMIYDDFVFPKLKNLEIINCPNFTPEMLERIITDCSFLETLTVVCCESINREIILDLMSSRTFKMMKLISVCSCHLPIGVTFSQIHFEGFPQFGGMLCYHDWL